MFDIGFLELLVIAVLGLLVIGPERLPSALKTGARTIGRIKNMARQARSDIEQQIGVDEIRQDLHNEQVLQSLRKLKELKEQTEKELDDELLNTAYRANDDPYDDEDPDYGNHHDETDDAKELAGDDTHPSHKEKPNQ